MKFMGIMIRQEASPIEVRGRAYGCWR